MIPSSRYGSGVIPYRDRAHVGSTFTDVTDVFTNVFGDQHPKDHERMANADRYAAAARAGDRINYLQLKCLSAVATPTEAAEFQQLTGTSCGTGWATAKARAYGAQLVQQVDAFLRQQNADQGTNGSGPAGPGPLPGLPGLSSGTLVKAAVGLGIALLILPPLFRKPRQAVRRAR
jgi:hypothetical protein